MHRKTRRIEESSLPGDNRLSATSAVQIFYLHGGVSDRVGFDLLGFREQLFDLRQFDFVVNRHLFDAHFLGVFNVGRQFRRMREDNPLTLHAILHYLRYFFLLGTSLSFINLWIIRLYVNIFTRICMEAPKIGFLFLSRIFILFDYMRLL